MSIAFATPLKFSLFAISQLFASSRSHAECIVLRSLDTRGLVSLGRFFFVTFSKCRLTQTLHHTPPQVYLLSAQLLSSGKLTFLRDLNVQRDQSLRTFPIPDLYDRTQLILVNILLSPPSLCGIFCAPRLLYYCYC